MDKKSPKERDLTLRELLEEPEMMQLGVTEESDAKKQVELELYNDILDTQVKAAEGDVENYMLLFKIRWNKHSNAPVMPNFYKSETNRNTIQNTVVSALARWKHDSILPPIDVEYISIDAIPLGVVLNCHAATVWNPTTSSSLRNRKPSNSN